MMTGTMLITGASSGIGRAVAEHALAAGWRVGLFARRRAALEEVATQGEALVLEGDVTRLEDLEAAVAEIAGVWGRLDVLFNNAGIFTTPGLIDEIDMANWQRSVDVNLTGMIHAARAAFGQMRRQEPRGGRIINNGSISAHSPRELAVCYTVTKHAITGLTKQLALDGRSLDIACGQIDIGNAETDMVRSLNKRLASEGKQPNPVMDVNDAARAVLHMAGLPLSANIQNLTILATQMEYVGRG